MNKSIFQTLALFVLLAIVQVLVCNNISILNFATPFVFIYVIVRLPLTLHRNWVMIIGFLAGLIIDIFGDTAGMNDDAGDDGRGSHLHDFLEADEIADPVPSAKTLGPGAYIKYLLTMTFVYCLSVTFIEAFTLHDFLLSLYRVVGCTALTFVILLGIDALVNAKK